MTYPDWRGYALAVFVVMGVANVYMSVFSLLRVDLRKTRDEAELSDIEILQNDADDEQLPRW